MGKRLCLFFFLFFLIKPFVFSQADTGNEMWTSIERSIKEKRNLDSVYRKLSQLKSEAKAGKNELQLVRAHYYLMQIDDQRKEDTFYFRNSAFIDTLLSQQFGDRAKLILHVLQAKRLKAYTSKSLKFNLSKYEIKDIPFNYAQFDKFQIDSIIRFHFESALTSAKKLNEEPIENYLWFASDPFVYLYKPVLYDLVAGERVHNFKDSERWQYPAANVIEQAFSYSQDEMIRHIPELSKQAKSPMFDWYGDWISFNHNRPEAYYYIETLLRKWIASGYYPTINADSLYAIYLEKISLSPLSTVRAHGVYQLCLWWNKESLKYSPNPNYDFSYELPFQPKYQFLSAKALDLFESNQQLLDSFAYLKSILVRMKSQILEKTMQAQMESHHLPNENILATLTYKNTAKLYYRIIKSTRYDGINGNRKEQTDQLLKRNVYREEVIDLKLPADHNFHRTHLKIAALEKGEYYLFFSDKPFTEYSSVINHINFTVSGIAMLNSDNRVYVLDRKTGMPISDAKVIGSYVKEIIKSGNQKEKKTIEKQFRTNKEGFAQLSDPEIDFIKVFYKEDSLYESIDQHEDRYDNDEMYDKEEYDDLVEYYTEHATMHIFTDRSIYRPGQTVYYKAIFLTRNPKTGDWMVMSKENMRGKFLQNWYKRWLKEDEPAITISDPFGKTMDSIMIKPNEYGSQSGTFKIPMSAATGEWEFDTDYYELGENEGIFHVEEYKRPSYEITVENPGKKLLYPGDSMVYKVKLRSFAGAALNNVRVEYELTRNGWGLSDDKEITIVKNSGFTNAEGEIIIRIVDSLAKNSDGDADHLFRLEYTMDAKAIDETGETYSVENEFEVTSRPVRINIPFARFYDRGTPASIKIQALDPANNSLPRTIQLKIWKRAKTKESKTVPGVDQWIFTIEELESSFPDITFRKKDEVEKTLVFEKNIQINKEENFELPFEKLPAGEYEAIGTSIENGKITGERSIVFAVFDLKSKRIPDSTTGFFTVPFNAINPGDSLKFLHGNSTGNYYTITKLTFYSRGKYISTKSVYYHEINQLGINNWAKTISTDAIDQLYLSQVYVLNNKLYRQGQTIFINSAATSEPEIIIEQYRKNLVPGAKETFVVSIKTKNENKAMELLTTMYDASLDKLEEHKWNKFEKERLRSISSSWPYSINGRTSSYDWEPQLNPRYDTVNAGLWWLNPVGYSYFSGFINNGTMLMGKVSGISLAQTDGLSEVVVTAYGTSMKRDLTGSMSLVTIRGQNSLRSFSMPLIILDGVPYTGDLSKLDPNIIKGAMVLKGADASAIYGARAAEGVLILSTKGEVIIPEVKEDAPQPKIRKNFSETAFFFPEVHVGKDGFFKFSFTMPESVTEWNWKLFAHGKQAQSVYEERKSNTQLPMMVQPHMPRLLYMGDKIVLQSRVTNLDTLETNGKINIKIEDLATGMDITNQVTSQKEKEFKVARKTNTSVGFELKIPAKQLNPLRIIVSASSANFADAEEHVLPVLNSKIFVRNSKSFHLTNKDTVITGPALPNDAEMYGLGLSINPKPQAALINSLPYLTNYPHSCAEQIFNKLYANAIAVKIMRSDSQAQESFRNALNKTPDSVLANLPDQLQDQTMPWLGLSNRTIQLQSQLMKLFDTVKTNEHIEELLSKLYKLQNADGGIAWFEGGKSNDYISGYLLAGFGKLKAEQLIKVPNIAIHQQFIDALFQYCSSRVRPQINDPVFQYYLLSNASAISFWKEEYTIADSVLNPLNNWIGEQMKSIYRKGLGEQSLLIISALRLSDRNSDNYKKALAQLSSIRQLANYDEANGMRWKDIADADDLNNSAEETIGLLAEAFDEAGLTNEINPGIVKWLLTTRDEDRWSTTKGTAAAISRIQKENKSAVGPSQSLNSKTLKLEVTDDNFSGKPFAFYRTTDNLGKVEVEKSSSLLARGSINWYYFSSQPALNPESSIQLEKELFVYNDETKTWAEVVSGTVLKLGQKVRISLTINANKALRFVYIDDKRAAAFEPVEIASGYNYSGGVSYYQSIRDAGMQIFAEFIPSGKSTISYEWVVSQEGEFLNGPASLQCMYKPEANAYSNSMIVRTTK